MGAKVDFRKELACYHARRGTPELVEVPDLAYLMIDGHGDPNSDVFRTAVAALYPLAYTLKFASKRHLDRDYVVPPLEGLWWADDMHAFTTARDPSSWHWTAMIMTPAWIGPEMLDEARAAVEAGTPPERLHDVRLGVLSERTCVQALHVGSFDEEGPLLERMHHGFIPDHGLRMVQRHHEIYLNDPRRTAPEKLRTILRQPVRPREETGS